jgi:LPS sulfotransferase NodH
VSAANEPLPIAFLLGCARSGTSIFAEAVAAHPEVKYIFEPHEIWEQAGHGENESHRLTAAHATPEICTRLRGWFGERRGAATLVLDKTPRNTLRVPFLRAVFPEAKFIHLVRDGRDVACSLMPGIGGDVWHHLKPPAWRELFAQHHGIERCALTWRDTLQLALADLRGVPHRQVRYEDLLAQPHATLAATWQFLGLPPAAAALEFAEKISDATDGLHHAAHQQVWFRNDHVRRTGRWRENLAPEEQETVGRLLHETLKALGYD